MKTQGTVIALCGSRATVRCKRSSACDGCHKKQEGECSVCSLMSHGATFDTVACNDVGAAVGDVVELTSDSRRMMLYALFVFLFPLLCMIGGYYLGVALFFSMLGGACSAIAALFLAFLLIRVFSETCIKRRDDVCIVAILTPADKESANQSKQ